MNPTSAATLQCTEHGMTIGVWPEEQTVRVLEGLGKRGSPCRACDAVVDAAINMAQHMVR